MRDRYNDHYPDSDAYRHLLSALSGLRGARRRVYLAASELHDWRQLLLRHVLLD